MCILYVFQTVGTNQHICRNKKLKNVYTDCDWHVMQPLLLLLLYYYPALQEQQQEEQQEEQQEQEQQEQEQ